MKRTMATMMVLSLFCAPAAFANEGMDVGKKVDKMKTQLNLTDDQASQVKGVLEAYKQQMEALKKDKHEKISAILTPEQRTKHEAMVKEWKEKKKDKHDDD